MSIGSSTPCVICSAATGSRSICLILEGEEALRLVEGVDMASAIHVLSNGFERIKWRMDKVENVCEVFSKY